MDDLINTTWQADRRQGREGALQRTVDNLVLHRMIGLANSGRAPANVRAIMYDRLGQLSEWLTARTAQQGDEADRAHFGYAARQIQRFLDDPSEFESYKPVRAPAGSPIGHDHGRYGCSLD